MFKKIIKWCAIIILSLGAIFLFTVRMTTFHPDDLEDVAVSSPEDAPVLQKGQRIKILTWNVQYMAGKNYVFFYDLLDGSGKDERPSTKDIAKTFEEVVRIINDEAPDIILIQEIDEGADPHR